MIKKHIPNALTCGNVVAGSIGVIFCFEGELYQAALCMLIGATFDFFDGFAARMLKVSSPMGKELDSLADMVSFGLLPGLVVYKMLQPISSEWWLPYIAMMIPAFSALRLAKFNIDTRQSDSFIGVPTPANALLIGSLPVIVLYHPEYAELVQRVEVLIPITVIMSFLLVAELPLLALKFKNFSFKDNKFRFVLIITSLLLIFFLKTLAVPCIVVFYIILSIINTQVEKGNKA